MDVPPISVRDELVLALNAMEAGFQVRLIGTFSPDLAWAPADAPAAEWLAHNHPEFDQFPVSADGATLGILYRNGDYGARSVRDAMAPLRDGLIVSGDMPIVELIPQLRDSHSRLVLRGKQIDGLVTQSDLLKLPVRMLLFGLITHLEVCLRTLIRRRLPWPQWLEQLNGEGRRRVENGLLKLRQERFEPDPLEFTNFADVCAILQGQANFSEEFRNEMEAIRGLRNGIAHAKTFIASAHDVREFVDCFENARKWIDDITRRVAHL